MAIPQQRGLALISDSYASNLLRFYACLFQRRARRIQTCVPDVGGIVLYPTRVGKVLSKLLLCLGDNAVVSIKNDSSGGSGPLIHGEDVGSAH